MVGDFSDCLLVQNAIKRVVAQNARIILPEGKSKLIVPGGAAYLGHFPNAFSRGSELYKHFQTKPEFKKMTHPKEMADRVLKIGFIGAGAINFGRLHLPWDHASRLEQIGGIEVVGIVELDEKLAREVLQTRQSSAKYGSIYKNCNIFKNYKDLIKLQPDAVFIGIPPAYRGSFDEGKDLELQFARAGIHVFVEKPLSVLPPEQFMSYAKAVTETCKEKNVIVSVGYMFRYHAGILKMKELIKQHGGKVMALNARYYFAYTKAVNKYWFNEDFSGGPIVEQATHFCDLARFIVSDVEIDTIHTLLLKDSDPSGAGHLDYVPQEAEDDITPAKRIPRVTMSHWRFKDGGLGTLMHSVALPGTRYEANIDVQLDGLKLSLIEPYEKDCILRVRSINNEDANKDQDFTFPSDDSYLTELGTFIKAIRTNDPSLVKSSYSDAALTYQMTWAIRRAS